MICSKCFVQMHQKDAIGGGEARDDKYITWELKECPACKSVVMEFYQCTVFTDKQIKMLTKNGMVPRLALVATV
jgi:hypothetical protein